MVAATTTTTATAATVAAMTTMMMTSGGRRLAIARRAGGVGPRGRAGAGQGCMATGQRHVGASAQELYAVAAASESATSTGPAMVAPECQPKVQLQASFTHLSMCTADGWYIQM
ncbi:Os11g0255800 [Oryza sativa Japonica Group]|uniref:Os11g0255800 protein n=1 Tax=Oryza sativa subsp. japonica TaxID=39947 RepID=A0A0P0Y0X4_ORYSJ|nr:Os11g0255800 [Oryza sativa Japonica Group]